MTTAAIASIITSGFLFAMLVMHGNEYDRRPHRPVSSRTSLASAGVQLAGCWAVAVFIAELFG